MTQFSFLGVSIDHGVIKGFDYERDTNYLSMFYRKNLKSLIKQKFRMTKKKIRNVQ